MVVHDLAYADIAFDGYKPPSFLQVPGAKDVGGRDLLAVEELQHAGLARRLRGAATAGWSTRWRASRATSTTAPSSRSRSRRSSRSRAPQDCVERHRRAAPQAPRRARRRPQRDRLAGPQAQGRRCSCGPRSRSRSASMGSLEFSKLLSRRQGGGVAGHRLRRVRRRPRALRARSRTSSASGRRCAASRPSAAGSRCRDAAPSVAASPPRASHERRSRSPCSASARSAAAWRRSSRATARELSRARGLPPRLRARGRRGPRPAPRRARPRARCRSPPTRARPSTIPRVQIVIELIGGLEPARDASCCAALAGGQARGHRQQGAARPPRDRAVRGGARDTA